MPCLASMFLTVWMTYLHDSYLAGSLLPGCGCWWLEAQGSKNIPWIQSTPEREERPQCNLTLAMGQPTQQPYSTAFFTLLLTLKFCICSGQFWCTIPSPAKSRSWNQFGCINLPDPAQESSKRNLQTVPWPCWLCVNAWSHHSSPFLLHLFSAGGIQMLRRTLAWKTHHT